jgi:hypothetical protein
VFATFTSRARAPRLLKYAPPALKEEYGTENGRHATAPGMTTVADSNVFPDGSDAE